MKLGGFTRLSTKLLAIFLLIVGVTLIGLFAILETRQYFSERRELVANLEATSPGAGGLPGIWRRRPLIPACGTLSIRPMV